MRHFHMFPERKSRCKPRKMENSRTLEVNVFALYYLSISLVVSLGKLASTIHTVDNIFFYSLPLTKGERKKNDVKEIFLISIKFSLVHSVGIWRQSVWPCWTKLLNSQSSFTLLAFLFRFLASCLFSEKRSTLFFQSFSLVFFFGG